MPEPKNPADPRAVAVFGARGVQIGYLSAERCGWIGGIIGQGRGEGDLPERMPFAAVVRFAFEGEEPVLPRTPEDPEEQPDESDFFPDWVLPEERVAAAS